MTEDYFTIRKASPADLPRIHGIYAAARQFMRDHGNSASGTARTPRSICSRGTSRQEIYMFWKKTA